MALVATPHSTETARGVPPLLFPEKILSPKCSVVSHSLGDFAVKSVTILIPEAKQAGELPRSPSSQELITGGAEGVWHLAISRSSVEEISTYQKKPLRKTNPAL